MMLILFWFLAAAGLALLLFALNRLREKDSPGLFARVAALSTLAFASWIAAAILARFFAGTEQMFFAAFIGAGVSGVVALMTWLAVAAASLARGIGSAGSGF